MKNSKWCLNLIVGRIAFNANRRITLNKRQRWPEWIKKKKKGKIQFYAVFKRFTLNIKAQIESKGGKSYTIQMVSIRLKCLN